MEPHNKKSFDEDDEEDLEALRLAALQSLKRKEEIGPPTKYNTPPMGFNRGKGGHKRGRFYGPPHQRINKNPKNGQFNNFNGRVRNSNLIAITPVTEEIPKDKDANLVLPQDRYTGNVPKDDKTNENTTSKFDRYEHSDQSDSESEEESAESGNDSPGKLEKADSLEALMQELDDEIQGIKKPKEEVVVPKKKVKKKRKVKSSESANETSESEPVKDCGVVEPEVVKVEETQAKENLKPEPQNNFRRRSRSISPKNRPMRKRKRNFYPPSYPMPPQNFPYPPMSYQPPPPFNPVYGPPMNPSIPPPYMMPLSINTDLAAVTMAPLSPRSARFVLENREIIEKRKRSPRRSYSRSPTPRRRSRSPRRSLSPFPRRQSLSPRRRSHSPKRLPKKEEVAKPPVRERLGLKSPEKKANSPVKEEEKPLDPVLEARKRKFESNEIKVKEGIIRLKPKDDKCETFVQEKKVSDDLDLDLEDINEDALLEDDEIDLGGKVDDLFSDEESSSDNEGRFKIKDNNKSEKVPVLSFTKLVNGNKLEIKDKPLIPNRRERPERSRRERRRRSRSPTVKTRITMKEPETTSKLDEEDKKISPEVARKRIVKSHISPPLDKRFERKIEIKIKNPAKYDQEENSPKNKRKVEIGPKNIVEELEDLLEDESEEDTNANEGDLRAQLSKKRAERLHKNVPMEGNASRLLQNALQGAVFTKTKKNKDKDLTNDGKLPIHLRLGVAKSEPKGRKKSKKSRNRSQEQVYNFDGSFFSQLLRYISSVIRGQMLSL